MIVYQVRAVVPEDKVAVFKEFMLGHHIADLVKTGCFTSGRLYHELTNPVEGTQTFMCEYIAPSEEQMKKYLSEFAPALRTHTLQTLGTTITYTRQFLTQSATQF